MLTAEENERLTRVGAGTPVGELMRRYWHPIAAAGQLASSGTRPVTVLGEDLVLYRDRSGALGLVGNRCPHRSAGLLFGVPEEEGLRCAYHGWRFDETGACLEQPYEATEDPESRFREKTPVKAYPVQELGGLIWAYLGPQPAPLVPRWDLLVMDGVVRDIGWAMVPCNWLQITENSLDPVHVEWLHQYFANYVQDRLGNVSRQRTPGKHRLIGFSEFEHGIIKRRILEGETEDNEDWAVGHPHVFPNMLKSGSTKHPVFQIRVPVDDVRTLYFWYGAHPAKPGDEPSASGGPEAIPVFEVPVPGIRRDGEVEWSLVDNNSGQDMAMWFTQGPITDRSIEHLGFSDQGVILYRKQLERSLRIMEDGGDPMNTFRDPAKNVRLDLAVEEAKLAGTVGLPRGQTPSSGNVTKYSPIFNAAEAR